MSLRLNNSLNKNKESYRYHSEIPNAPHIPLCSPIKKKSFKKDWKLLTKKFIATIYDIDIYMRLFAIGYKLIFSNIKIKEIKYSNYSLNKDYYMNDRKYLDSLWTKKSNKKIRTKFGDFCFKKKMSNSRLGPVFVL